MLSCSPVLHLLLFSALSCSNVLLFSACSWSLRTYDNAENTENSRTLRTGEQLRTKEQEKAGNAVEPQLFNTNHPKPDERFSKIFMIFIAKPCTLKCLRSWKTMALLVAEAVRCLLVYACYLVLSTEYGNALSTFIRALDIVC